MSLFGKGFTFEAISTRLRQQSLRLTKVTCVLLAKKVLKARISSRLCAVACRGKFSWQRMAEKSEGVFTDVFFLNYNEAFAWQDELFMPWHIRNTAG